MSLTPSAWELYNAAARSPQDLLFSRLIKTSSLSLFSQYLSSPTLMASVVLH